LIDCPFLINRRTVSIMALKQFRIRSLFVLTIILACILALYSAEKHSVQRLHNEQKRELASLISAIDGFVQRNNRCPTVVEFDAMAERLGLPGAIINTGTQHVKDLGGTGKNDYIVGTWDGDQEHFYRSWDKRLYFDETQRIYDYYHGNR